MQDEKSYRKLMQPWLLSQGLQIYGLDTCRRQFMPILRVTLEGTPENFAIKVHFSFGFWSAGSSSLLDVTLKILTCKATAEIVL